MALLLALVMLLGVLPMAASAEYEMTPTENQETELLTDNEPVNEPPEGGQPVNEQSGNEPSDDKQTNDDPPIIEPPDDESLDLSEDLMPSDDPDITASFTDANFLAAVRTLVGKAHPAPILKSDVAGRTILNVGERNISSLAGIEHFTALEELDLWHNNLTTLDVRSNPALRELELSWNNLTTLNVRSNPALRELSLAGNKLTTLDVRNNTALTRLVVAENNLTTLDVRSNTALEWLSADENNLTTLNVGNNTALEWLSAHSNQLTTLDVGHAPSLKQLHVYGNQLTTLDVSNVPSLERLQVTDNNLKALDVSKNTALRDLYANDNQLTTLNVGNNTVLNQLFANNNQLTTINVSNNSALRNFNLAWNELTTIDVSKNPALEWLVVAGNNLTTIDVRNNTALEILGVSGNKLTSLDVSNNASIEHLSAQDNELTSIRLNSAATYVRIDVRRNHLRNTSVITGKSGIEWDTGEFFYAPQNVSQTLPGDITHYFECPNFLAEVRTLVGKAHPAPIMKSDVEGISELHLREKKISSLAGVEHFTALGVLWANGNQLTSLDVSSNTTIWYIDVSDNNITALDVSKNTALRNFIISKNNLTTLDVSNNPVLRIFEVDENQLTSLDVSNNPALELLLARDNNLTTLDVSNNPALRPLAVNNNNLTTLDVSNNTELTHLYIAGNSLTSLDMSNNTKLVILGVESNQLTTLDVSNNPVLRELDASDNHLSALDVSSKTALELLNVSRNQLTTLNVSSNTALTHLHVEDNQLTTLDVSNNAALGSLTADNNELTSVILHPTAPYTSIDVRQNRMVDTSVITGRSNIDWDTGDFHFDPQKLTFTHGVSLSRSGTNPFPSVPFGSSEQTSMSATITNTGNSPSGGLTIVLSGTNAGSFTLSTASLPSLTAGSSRSFTVVPIAGLSPGIYTATVTVSHANVESGIETMSFNVHLVVTKATRSDTPSAPTEVPGSRTTTSVTLEALPDIEYAMSLTNRAPHTGWQDGVDSLTFSGLAQITQYYFFARYKETETHYASEASEALHIGPNKIPISIRITPTYSRAKIGQAEPINLQVRLSPAVIPESILWDIGVDVFNHSGLGGSVIELTVAPGAPVKRQPISVAVTVDGVVYRAHAEVNVVTGTLPAPADRTARLANNTAEINRAKKDEYRGVEVPIVLNYIPVEDADRTVRLYRNYGTNKLVELTRPGGPLTAELSKTNTSIEINYKAAVEKNESFKGVTVFIGDNPIRATGTLNISVINRFPQRLTAIAEPLDLFYGNDTIVTLVDADGVKYSVNTITPRNSSARDRISTVGNRVELKPGNRNRTGNIPVRVTVSPPEEYISLKAGGNNTHDINIRVVNSTPSLRLSSSTVTLLNDRADNNRDFTGAATIRLLTRNAKIPFESFYKIKSVTSPDVRVEYISRDGFGELRISPQGLTAQAGRTNLLITFEGSDREVVLPLTVKTFNPKNLRPSPAKRSVTVNVNHARNTDIVTLPINLNVPNLVIPDWRVVSVGGGIIMPQFNTNFEFIAGDNNMITFRLREGANLNSLLGTATKLSIPIQIGSHELNRMNNITAVNKQRTVTVTLVIIRNDASFTVSQRGRIDISNPLSAIEATIRLNNTSERIEGVRLLERRLDVGGQIIPNEVSEFFRVEYIHGENTFRIIARENKTVIPGVRQTLGVEVRLVGRSEPLIVNINITPTQTRSKAWQSTRAVTLLAAKPQTGEDIRLNLTTPANVRLGHVNIQQASLDNLRFIKDENGTPLPENAFEIVRNGGSSWTIRFNDGEVPWGTTNKAGTAKTPLKSSYNIRLELWAEGTYELDINDNPTALGSGKTASRPTLVTVRVNIRPLNQPPAG